MQDNRYLLFFDTETTGVPANYNAPLSDFKNWPRLVQAAWIICDLEQNIVEAKEYIIYPDGFEIPEEAANVHGINTEKAKELGVNLHDVLNEFSTDLNKSVRVIGHNIDFDISIMGSELLRANMTSKLTTMRRICTMKSSTDFCEIPGNYGYKWPKLEELHIKLFGLSFADAHNALADVEATIKCFWELVDIGVIGKK